MSGSELAPFVAAVLRDKVVEELLEENKLLKMEKQKLQKDLRTKEGWRMEIISGNDDLGVAPMEIRSVEAIYAALQQQQQQQQQPQQPARVVYATTIVRLNLESRGDSFGSFQYFDNVTLCTLGELRTAVLRVQGTEWGTLEDLGIGYASIQPEEPPNAGRMLLGFQGNCFGIHLLFQVEQAIGRRSAIIEAFGFDDSGDGHHEADWLSMEVDDLLDILGGESRVTFERIEGRDADILRTGNWRAGLH